MRFLLDMGLPRRLANDLCENDWNTIHITEVAAPTTSDLEIVELAAHESRVIITSDNDFAQIIALRGWILPSIINIREQSLKRPEVLSLLKKLIPQISQELEEGCIVSVTTAEARVRKLPIER